MSIEREVLSFVAKHPELYRIWEDLDDESADTGADRRLHDAWDKLAKPDAKAADAALRCATRQVEDLVTDARARFREIAPKALARKGTGSGKVGRERWHAYDTFQHTKLHGAGVTFYVLPHEGARLELVGALWVPQRSLKAHPAFYEAFSSLRAAKKHHKHHETGVEAFAIATRVDLSGDQPLATIAESAAAQTLTAAKVIAAKLGIKI
ncbi:MAG: hypothetical protein IT383_01135 [Deltaproteobacteria bacterium]|nr:hypothetical protein [Deltaproteobacteria bacterium]